MQQPPSSPADQLASQYQLGMLRDISFENKLSGQINCSGSSREVTINIHREKAKRNGWPIQIHIPFGEIPNAHVLRRLLIFAREQQAPTHFVLFGVFNKDVAEALSPVN